MIKRCFKEKRGKNDHFDPILVKTMFFKTLLLMHLVVKNWKIFECDATRPTLLDEHNSPQWYDIVHFEHKLS